MKRENKSKLSGQLQSKVPLTKCLWTVNQLSKAFSCLYSQYLNKVLEYSYWISTCGVEDTSVNGENFPLLLYPGIKQTLFKVIQEVDSLWEREKLAKVWRKVD